MCRNLRGCSLALLLFGLLAPAARAEHCGRYIVAEAEYRQQLARLLEGVANDRLPGLPNAPEPCRGSLCSGQPAAPASPVATPTPPGEDWACPVATVEPRGLLSHLRATDAAEARPIRRGPSIFHPPRAAFTAA
jgi:hypothetical protein